MSDKKIGQIAAAEALSERELRLCRERCNMLEHAAASDAEVIKIVHAEARKLRALIWTMAGAHRESIQAGLAGLLAPIVDNIYGATSPDATTRGAKFDVKEG